MPIYEYVCSNCQHAFEIIVRGQQTFHCPKCDSNSLTRQLSIFAVSTPTKDSTPAKAIQPCGTCGDPRGPGACSLN